MVSEQAAFRLDLALGDDAPFGLGQVVGIYADYGNPRAQILASREALRETGVATSRLGIGIRIDPQGRESFLAAFRAEFDAGPAQGVDQSTLKDRAREIFEQTFAVTAALNVLTLLVAGAALFASLLTLADRRLANLAPVWAIGLSRRRLAMLELSKTVAATVLTAMLAIPVGLLLAWLLVAVINVQAFGWRLPLYLFPGEWVRLVGLALGVAVLASILPVRRLARISPGQLLKVFRSAA